MSRMTAHQDLVALGRKLQREDLSQEEREGLEQEAQMIRDIWSE